jgi:hypothetical protein
VHASTPSEAPQSPAVTPDRTAPTERIPAMPPSSETATRSAAAAQTVSRAGLPAEAGTGAPPQAGTAPATGPFPWVDDDGRGRTAADTGPLPHIGGSYRQPGQTVATPHSETWPDTGAQPRINRRPPAVHGRRVQPQPTEYRAAAMQSPDEARHLGAGTQTGEDGQYPPNSAQSPSLQERPASTPQSPESHRSPAVATQSPAVGGDQLPSRFNGDRAVDLRPDEARQRPEPEQARQRPEQDQARQCPEPDQARQRPEQDQARQRPE